MIFLPDSWRFVLYNKNTGVTLDFSSNSANESAVVAYRTVQGDGSGGATHTGESTASASTDLASGSYEFFPSAGLTGQTDVDLYGQLRFETDNSSASGDVILGIEHSTDGQSTPTWPSASSDFDADTDLTILTIINISGSTTLDVDWTY